MPRPVARLAVAALVALLASACASGGIPDPGIDHTIVTSATEADTALPGDPSDRSDALTVRNAITSADLVQLAGRPLGWANADTGSEGAIEAVTEYEKGGRTCRRFAGTRQSYRGVGRIAGDACLFENGAWRLLAFTG